MSTPRDYNQPPWPQRPNQGPNPGQQPGWDPRAETQFGPPPQWRPPQQPAQPPQPPPQWGQPPRQPAPPSPQPAPSTPKKKSSKTPLLVAGAIVAVLIVVAVVAVVMMSGGAGKDVSKIAVADVQTEVPKVLVDRTDGYESGDIKDVKCNNGEDPKGAKGDTFTCTATVRGKQHKLTVTFQDDKGTYVVGLPELEGGK